MRFSLAFRHLFGWISLAAALTVLLGGQAPPVAPTVSAQRSEVNPGWIFGYEYPMLNVYRTAGVWSYGDGSGKPAPDELDANGYPTYPSAANISHRGVSTLLAGGTPVQWERPGHYVLSWTGAGNLGMRAASGRLMQISCTGNNHGNAGGCDNTGCTAMTGSLSDVGGVPMLNVLKAPIGINCTLVVGQPISGAGVVIGQFGTPTVITGRAGSPNCGSCTGNGGTGSYRVNFAQTVAAETMYPGGRLEMSISGESGFASGGVITSSLLWSGSIGTTGTSRSPTNTVQSVGFYYSCLFSKATCVGNDDEETYWTGEQFGDQFMKVMRQQLYGVVRDLGWSNNNIANCTTWSTRKPLAYYGWQAPEFRASLYVGVPTMATDTINFSGYVNDGGAPNDRVSGLTLTVTAVAAGPLRLGLYLAPGVIVSNQLTSAETDGTPGGRGTYQLGWTKSYTAPQTFSLTSADFAVTRPIYSGTTTYGAGQSVLSAGVMYVSLKDGNTGNAPASSPTLWQRSADGGPVDKQTIIVKWGNNVPSSTTHTISLDGGATVRPVVNSGGTVNMAKATPVAGVITTMVYDAEIGAWMRWGYGNTSSGIDCGVPPEAFIKLNAELGTDPWLTEHYMAADPITDYVPQLAAYIRDNYPGMVPHFETPNELWNGSVDPSIYAASKMAAHAHADRMILNATAAAAASGSPVTLTFASVPSWVVPGMEVNDLSGLSGFFQIQVRVLSKTSTTVTVGGGYVAAVAIGDQIGFGWSATQQPGYFFYDDEEGKMGSLLCQAVSAAYGAKTDRYKCIIGVATIPESGFGTYYANPRLLATNYMTQNVANLPIQAGYLQSPSYLWATNLAVETYWGLGEMQSQCMSTCTAITWPQEAIDGYCYYSQASGCPSRKTVMDNYTATANYQSQGISYNKAIWSIWRAWAKGCAGGGPCAISINPMLAYEGGYAQALQPVDLFINVTGVTQAASPCVLNTAKTIPGSINGNTISLSVNNSFVYNGSVVSGMGVSGSPIVLGPAWGVWNTAWTISGSTQTVASTPLTFSPPSGVAGMPVTLTTQAGIADGMAYNSATGMVSLSLAGNLSLFTGNRTATITVTGVTGTGSAAAVNGTFTAGVNYQGNALIYTIARGLSLTIDGGSGTVIAGTPGWGAVNGKSYTIRAGATNGSMPINLDCTSLGPLSGGLLTFTGSANWINYLRNASYIAPQLETLQVAEYEAFADAGGSAPSQLSIASPNTLNAGWLVTGSDIYGYWPMGMSTASTISGITLTLGGSVHGLCELGDIVGGANVLYNTTVISILRGTGGSAGDALLLSKPVRVSPAGSITCNHAGYSGVYNGIMDWNKAHSFLRKRD